MASSVPAVSTSYRPPESSSGTWTSWIPLVTPYAGHDPQCSTKFWGWCRDSNYVAWDPGFGISIQDLHCVPEAATTVWDHDRLGSNSDTVVSIGPITCPKAFRQVATSVIDDSRTMVACCPLEYSFAEWKSPGDIGQCYSEIASGDILTVYTSNSEKKWAPFTRTMNVSSIVIGAHINGWIFADQTPTPAAPTVTVSMQSARSSATFSSTTSAVVFGIGVALAVVGVAMMAAGLVIMRRLRKTLRRRVAQSAVHVPGNRLALSRERCQHRPMHQASHGGLFPTVPAWATPNTARSDDKEAHELDGSFPSC
ncbi:hypothetical protein F5883DRAFT_570774 [Diaporthe sp. PMI_573]|nr:hypothetical protein F5883DRAFT_570774 [Diaporthaceae sp. PMI_573]